MIFLRVIAALSALPLTYVAFLVLRAHGFSDNFDVISYGIAGAIMVPALLCWWFAIRGNKGKARAVMLSTIIGALALGGIGLVAGFFGPMIFSPQANQGPLLGIILTGPIGACIGAILGFVIGCGRTSFSKERRDGTPPA